MPLTARVQQVDELHIETKLRVELVDVDEECLLRLSHLGLGKLVRSYADGWPVHLSYLEAAVLGDPLPTSQFWNMHATIARLPADISDE